MRRGETRTGQREVKQVYRWRMRWEQGQESKPETQMKRGEGPEDMEGMCEWDWRGFRV